MPPSNYLSFHSGDPLNELVGEILSDQVQLFPHLLPEVLLNQVFFPLLLPGQLIGFVMEIALLVLQLLFSRPDKCAIGMQREREVCIAAPFCFWSSSQEIL